MPTDEVVRSLLEDVKRLNKDVYFGNGPNNLPLTTRVAAMEEALKDIKWMKRMSIGTFLTVLGGIVLWLSTGKGH